MAKRRKKKKKRGFTDTCYMFYTAVWLCIIFVAMLLTVLSGYIGIMDMSPINTAVEKSTEVMMVFTGFIVWKAKSENINKYGKGTKVEEVKDDLEYIDLG